MRREDSEVRTGVEGQPAAEPATWWGAFELGDGELGRWRIGPLTLWLRRTSMDWRYAVTRENDPLDGGFEVDVPSLEHESSAGVLEEQARIGFSATDANIELTPALADRAVVARPAVPFFVPPGERVELFLSTPLWVRLRSGGAQLADIPTARPSDTWFGNNTRGELAYATKTMLRRRLDAVRRLPHLAVSTLTIHNAAKSMLSFERLSLPVPHFSLYASANGRLWTEHVSVRYEDDGALAQVSLGKGPPPQVEGATRLAGPRQQRSGSFGSLVFGGLFDAAP